MSEMLPVERLTHGAYYAGKLGDVPAVARWHGTKHLFVLAQITLGGAQVRALAHAAAAGSAEGFAPLAPATPDEASTVTDFAFETCA